MATVMIPYDLKPVRAPAVPVEGSCPRVHGLLSQSAQIHFRSEGGLSAKVRIPPIKKFFPHDFLRESRNLIMFSLPKYLNNQSWIFLQIG
jgi:hypothetical protein